MPDCLATHVHAHLAYLDLCSSHFHLLASPRTTFRNARRLSHALRRPLSADLSASALNSLPQPYCPAVVLLPLCRLAAPSLRLSISRSDSPLCVIHDPCVASASICPALPLPRAGPDSFCLASKHVFVNQHPGGQIQPLFGGGRQLVRLLLLQLAVVLEPVRLPQGQGKGHGTGQSSAQSAECVQLLSLILLARTMAGEGAASRHSPISRVVRPCVPPVC